MPVSGGKVTAPVGLASVANLLGVAADVASVCTASMLNKWSWAKPAGVTTYNQKASTTFSDSPSAKADNLPFGGIWIKEAHASGIPATEGQWPEYAAAVKAAVSCGWDYAKPVAGKDWMRLSDFVGYDQNALPPIQPIGAIQNKKLTWDCTTQKSLAYLTSSGGNTWVGLSDFAAIESSRTLYMALALGDTASSTEDIDSTYGTITSIDKLVFATAPLTEVGVIKLVPGDAWKSLRGTSRRAYLVAVALNDRQIAALGTKLTSGTPVTPWEIDTGSSVVIYPLPFDDRSSAWFILKFEAGSTAPVAAVTIGSATETAVTVSYTLASTPSADIVVSITVSPESGGQSVTKNVTHKAGTTATRAQSFAFADMGLLVASGQKVRLTAGVTTRFSTEPESAAVAGLGAIKEVTIP